jgi:hypothetical protein
VGGGQGVSEALIGRHQLDAEPNRQRQIERVVNRPPGLRRDGERSGDQATVGVKGEGSPVERGEPIGRFDLGQFAGPILLPEDVGGLDGNERRGVQIVTRPE